jgi:hypothetical protein
MLSLLVAVIAAGFLLLSHPAYGRPAEGRATFSISITILPKCITELDEASLEVREHCNSRSPYRISTLDIPPGLSAARVTDTGSRNSVPMPYSDHCDPESDCRVTVIYY